MFVQMGLGKEIYTYTRQNYSVPYEYIKQRVDVRLTRSAVEVFFEGTRIASHLRLYGRPNQYSTVEAHMPPDHQKYLEWNGDRFLQWAGSVGPNTQAVVRQYLTAYKIEQQGYKACMALLKLQDKYSAQRLEDACCRALSFTPRPGVKVVQSILRSGQDKLLSEDKEESPKAASQYSFTRGADYYRRDK